MTTKPFARTRERYLISSDRSLLSLTSISAAFASDAMYWCKPLPLPTLRTCLDNSFNLGLYLDEVSTTGAVGLATPPKPEQIGLARIITDYTTFAYLTDVYVVPEEQGKGLGKWLIACVDEVLKAMGDLRGAHLFTGEGKKEEFYEREMGMKRLEQGERGLVFMRRAGEGEVGRMRD
ncbi:hypothetical protein MMC12_006186 [Toensbergia leucococca]|nr:hypothetical protein [Toensbergia leucococca]